MIEKYTVKGVIFSTLMYLDLLILLVTLGMCFVPKDKVYAYVGDIQEYRINYSYTDPETRMNKHVRLSVTYTDKSGKTVHSVDEPLMSETMMRKSEWKYAFVINPWIFAPYWMAGFCAFTTLIILLGFILEPEELWNPKELLVLIVYCIFGVCELNKSAIKKFIGK